MQSSKLKTRCHACKWQHSMTDAACITKHHDKGRTLWWQQCRITDATWYNSGEATWQWQSNKSKTKSPRPHVRMLTWGEWPVPCILTHFNTPLWKYHWYLSLLYRVSSYVNFNLIIHVICSKGQVIFLQRNNAYYILYTMTPIPLRF